METVRRSFAVIIAFPQLKCTSNERGSKQNSSRARARARSQAVVVSEMHIHMHRAVP